MARTTSVVLEDHFADFIDLQVQGGRYGSASEVVRAALRLLEEQDARVEGLRMALVAGEQSGPPMPFDNAAFMMEMRAKHAR